ncbi:hypothetical protein BFF78_37905 [Streptomyces fodineus]|uniref:Coenzyme PQQ synthesis protein A n=1 Tax=Streptomyces fodineus TaxID=1904616 RepID=A0A1D7YKH9_9ACTN|nr:hypothetical protein [Streptomyces fodineus]AOR36061.1 hypothetical protein BFF78_37905 [Streptomyces fodineus]
MRYDMSARSVRPPAARLEPLCKERRAPTAGDAVGDRRRRWVSPQFADFETPHEVTAYAGRR